MSKDNAVTAQNSSVVRVRNVTKQKLDDLGTKNQSYDDIIAKLIKRKE